jgi:hydroxymethylpyrimidine pyrophosphatase-like HAD family hydrolase
MKKLIIGIDFDGTVVQHAYPEIGEPIEGAIETIKRLQDCGHKIILYTMRSRDTLAHAVQYLSDHGINLYGVNHNKAQHHWTESPKVYCHIYIDDAAVGCPLHFPEGNERPFVNWNRVTEELISRGAL